MMERLKKKWELFLFNPSMGEPLSLLRLVLGAMMFIKGLFLFPHIDDLYGQYGYLQAPLMESIGGGNFASWTVRAGIPTDIYSAALHVFFITHLISAVAFCVGFKTRVSNFVLWFTQSMLFQLAWVSAYGIDAYSQNLCFMMLWLPVGRFWSIDARKRALPLTPSWVCTLGLRCLQIYLLITYADAGVSKAMGTDWWTGAAIWDVLHLPEFNHINFFWLASFPWIAKIFAIGTVFLESFYIVGVWIPKIGKLWALSIILMHLVIASLIGLTLFGLTLALINTALFLAPDWLAARRNRRTTRSSAPGFASTAGALG